MSLFPVGINRWIVAHRGMSAHGPENTRAAFEAAVACGADAIECDLQLTADHQIVVCHDATLDRFGHAGISVRDTTLPDLQTRDAGSWFDPKFCDERMMSLPEVLCDFGQRIVLLLELKTQQTSMPQTEVLIHRLLSDLSVTNQTQRLPVLCFDYRVLDRLHQLSDQITETELELERHPWLDGIDCRIDGLSQGVVRLIQERRLAAFTFACNTDEEVLKALDLHVDGIITDDPEKTRTILRTHGRIYDSGPCVVRRKNIKQSVTDSKKSTQKMM